MNPIIVFNFKSYKNSLGKKGEELVKSCDFVSNRKFKIICCVQNSDLLRFEKSKIDIYAQHVDSVEAERNTGFVTIESVLSSGGRGSLLNHSEHKVELNEIILTLKKAKKLNFKIILCVKNLDEAKRFLKFNPEMISLEIPELIATGKSITDYDGKEVMEFSKIVSDYNLKNKCNIKSLCGAGISNGTDLQRALEFGCDGVLLSSAFVNAKNKKSFLKEFISKVAK